MKNRKKALFLGIVFSALVLAGCGEEAKNPAEIPFASSAGSSEKESLQPKKDVISDENSLAAENSSEAGNSLAAGNSSEAENSSKTGHPSGKDSAEEKPVEEGAPAVSHKTDQGSISLIMVGDVLLHTPLAEGGRTEDGSYDFSSLFSGLRDEISKADLALVNQEVIIGGKELGVSGYPCFNAPYELGDALADAGFDVVLHATNHALDKGKKGLLNCLNYWREEHPEITPLGIHDSLEDRDQIYVYEKDGIRIAVLNYTYGTNGIPLPEDMPYAVDLLDRDRVAEEIQRAQKLADFTIVCPHWGTEYRLNQSKEQEVWTELFAENGADLVIGTHPHVIEPVVWLKKEDGQWMETEEAEASSEGVLVYYSLGNFCNWTSGTGDGVANRMVGGMAKVTIGKKELDSVEIIDWDVWPLVCHLEEGFGGATVYPLADYTEEMASGNAIRKQDGNFSLEYCEKLAESVFGR